MRVCPDNCPGNGGVSKPPVYHRSHRHRWQHSSHLSYCWSIHPKQDHFAHPYDLCCHSDGSCQRHPDQSVQSYAPLHRSDCSHRINRDRSDRPCFPWRHSGCSRQRSLVPSFRFCVPWNHSVYIHQRDLAHCVLCYPLWSLLSVMSPV